MDTNTKVILGVALAGLALIPVWRSGSRENMTFPQFVAAHTIYGQYPEYIPLDALSSPLTQQELDRLNSYEFIDQIPSNGSGWIDNNC